MVVPRDAGVPGPADYANPLTVNAQVIADIADWIIRN